MATYGKVLGNAISYSDSFVKEDGSIVAFTKTGTFSVSTSTEITVEVANTSMVIASGTPVSMDASPVAGTDYTIWVTPSKGLTAVAYTTTPPVTNAKLIGGFHYAPGGNATGTTGGDTTPAINAYSFWDLNFCPANKDARGMTLVADNFWCDIYLTGVDAITNGSSKYNVTIADGSSPPKIPAIFGGNGTATYTGYTWFEAQELAIAFGKKCPTQSQYMVACYGVTEQTSRGTDPVSTILDAPRTSKWGLIGATGNLYVWGRDRGGPYVAAYWNANTESRGSEYNAPNASLFGGHWLSSSYSGSRCSVWNYAASLSYDSVGSRFVCDHLILD